MTSFRESRSPTVPSRSPFRIRDSQLSKMTDSMDRWSFTSELDSLWNMKPKTAYNKLDAETDTMFSSSKLLTELLISQAIIDSSEFKPLSFDHLEALKKESKVISDSIKHTSKNLQLETRIKNISKSLENANLKSSRHSVLYLKDQRQSNENKISQMSEFLKGLKERQVEIKKALLQHTAAVLNKGIQDMELTAAKKRQAQPDYSDTLVPLQNELDLIARKINKICASKFNTNLSSSTVEKLLQLEKSLQTGGTGNQLASLNHLGNPKSALNEPDAYNASYGKMQLVAIEQQKDAYYNKMMDLELLTTKLLSHANQFSQRQKALQMECMLYKAESIELEIWHKTWERDHDSMETQPSSQANEPNNYQLFEQQAKKFESEINQQNILIQRSTRMCQQLDHELHSLSDRKTDLEKTIQEKSRLLDEKDNRITQLHQQLRSQKQAPQPSNRYDTQLYEQAKRQLNQAFQQRETRWTNHTHQKEDQFDELLEKFDKLTNAAMEFDTDRMRYDKRVSQLTHNVSELEMELITQKIKRLGFNNHEAPTTQLLRKEFRQLVAEIKHAHQIRMEQEAEEVRRLQFQLEEMHNTNHHQAYKYQQHMSTQTDY